ARPGAAGHRLPRDLVKEPQHGGQPAVAVGHGDVEPDDHGFHAVGAETPGEPGLAVVAVHRAEQGEAEAGELLLYGRDRGVDGLAPGHLAEWVGVARVRGPDLVDELAAQPRVGLVPAGDVPLDDLVHGFLLGLTFPCGRHRSCARRPRPVDYLTGRAPA